ncbi:hypothetical protein HPP92_013578 [Vanilla planifolia]|uniref:Uncharacterized protein n=1 Tax=Vanilla planifolia TaxID=51239 RepID=A0A835QYU6_VANPL|nr:hypothetical protein HPP92_014017 [Vanilla planifolia]KAG0478859.1 hypothetical protein HPP92_013578 [Vanilla planifolia]
MSSSGMNPPPDPSLQSPLFSLSSFNPIADFGQRPFSSSVLPHIPNFLSPFSSSFFSSFLCFIIRSPLPRVDKRKGVFQSSPSSNEAPIQFQKLQEKTCVLNLVSSPPLG